MTLYEGIKKNITQLSNTLSNSRIYRNYSKKIDDNAVYLESRDGKDFTGNIFRIVEELSSGDYGNLKLYVFANKDVKNKIKELKSNYNLKIHKIVTNEAAATRILQKAKYIVSDSGIRHKFVKRDNQIFLYTFHGTPFKKMGFDNTSEEHTIGSVQHPLLSADYLLFPNDYMKDKMLNAYLIDELYPGKLLMEGFPRNCTFFDDQKRLKLKTDLNLNGKEIFIYMPTFRGTFFEATDDENEFVLNNDYFLELDKNLKDNQIIFVKLHIFNEVDIDFSLFDHIKPFPKGYENYDVLNLADVLITDYSSVFFDFANTRRKIILFNYDEEEYMYYRGTYFPLSDLPFPKVRDVSELIKELNSDKLYDDSEFIKTFCQYDNPNAIKNVCQHVFKNNKLCKEEIITTEKPNILIFAGALYNNGLTTSLISILSNININDYNIYLSYRQWEWNIRQNHEDIFKKFPKGIKYLPIRSRFNSTLREKYAYEKYINKDAACKDVKYPKILDDMFERELKRIYPGISFDKMIHFDGYGEDAILLYKYINCDNLFWVHNDMVQECKTKGNQKWYLLKEAFNNYKHVVSVSPDLIKSILKISDEKIDVKIVHNVCNYKDIDEKSKKEIIFNKHSLIETNHVGGIQDVLNSPGKKFITIGRFSPEKGHERLLLAFDEFCKEYPDTQLIIIGGHGTIYEKTLELRKSLDSWKNITIIKSISNPMPILKRCDLFILSSFYEGWPMVLMEANVLDIPIIATNIIGTQWMKDFNGHIVGNSKKEILQGFYDFMECNVKDMTLDYEEYNRNAIKEFTDLLN